MIYEAEVTATEIKIHGQSVLTSGSVKVDQVHFTFSPDSVWDGCARTAVFLSGSRTVAVVLDETNQCYIPKEVLATTDLSVFVGAYGVVGGNITVIPTVYGMLGKVRRGADQTADNSPEPTPTLMQQTLAQFAADKAITAADRQRCDQDAEATAADRQAVTAAGQSITAEGARQVDAVQTAGAAQVLAVQNKGAEVIAAVDAKKTAADQSAADAQQAAADAALAKTQAQAAAGQTAQDKTAAAADRQAVAQDKQTVVATGQQVAADAGQVSADKIAAESAKAAAEAAQAAIGINGANMFASPIWQKASGASVSVTPAAGSNFEVQLNGATIQPGTGDPSPTNIRPISGVGDYRSNGYYTDIVVTTNGVSKTYTIGPMSAPLYDGDTVDFVSGEVVRKNRKVVFDGVTYKVNGTFGKNIAGTAEVLYSTLNGVGYNHLIDGGVSNKFAYTRAAGISNFVLYGIGGNSGAVTTCLLGFPPDTTVTSANVWLSENPVEFYYHLSTPTTETVPISEPITVAPTQTDKYNPQPTVIAAAGGTVTVGYNMDGTAAYNTLKTAIAALGGT